MAKKTAPLLPSTDELLCQLGARLRVARLRRKLPAKQVAERAGMSPMTLRSVERGGAGVTLGAYVAVMQVLGVEQDLNLLAQADPVGRDLQDSRLQPASRAAHVLSQTGRSAPSSRVASLAGTVLASYPATRRLAPSGALERLREDVEALPAAQLRRAVEALPESQLRKALTQLPSRQLRETLKQVESPAEALEAQVKVAGSDWLKKSGFANSEALSGLIKRPPGKTGG
ncbi:helix-turn-helix transcriptional regulator [Caenimonas sedimenti]|uniref:Helix-turn-helix transcriptional regulator n=1 Tax=Caenimonas sedimenti TaxID=2596921 RepID=A0A562ZT26_9BURK|nr:helix-turn-helix transcriptional regulator [Caenimonas sedimenti]TWO71516.1 helix-turn-helix transcriptional regulator [Caenimonas sedimenti]